MAGLKLKNICKLYPNGYNAVKNLSLDIEDKEFIVLVGPSGCGKSTTLRMIAGLEEISSGELYIGNKLVNEVEPKDRDIAMVFQNHALYPHLNVYENMAFSLKISKKPKSDIDRKVIEVAKLLRIENILNRKPKELSGGQSQRVALGRAIVRNPRVFLMDEPLSNLDTKLRTQMRMEISKLHKKLGTTFIYVTHDHVEAMTMADRIVIMKDGVIQQIGTPKQVYNNPCNIFVASFIGAPQMNFIDAKVIEYNEGVYVRFNKTKIALSKQKSDMLRLKGYIGKEVILGIRPEDVYLVNNKDKGFEATVEICELTGSEIYVYLDVNGIPITARFDGGHSINTDDKLKLSIDEYKIHIFDKETKKNLLGSETK